MLKNIDFIESITPNIFKLVLKYMEEQDRTFSQSINDLKLIYQEPLLRKEYILYLRKKKLERLI